MKFPARTRPRYTPALALPAILVLLASTFASTASRAAETGIPAITAYRLGAGPAGASRLAAFRADAPAATEPTAATPRPRFADRRFARLIEEAARNAALDPALVHAVIAVESGYNPAARSAKGAIGLMQVLPETASRYGVADPASSPEANLRAGTRYLGYLMLLFDNRVDLVLAAYNAGEYAVLRHGHRIPPYRETQRYVPAVLAQYREWREQEPVPAVAPVVVGVRYMPGTKLDPGVVYALIYHGDAHRPGRHQLRPNVSSKRTMSSSPR